MLGIPLCSIAATLMSLTFCFACDHADSDKPDFPMLVPFLFRSVVDPMPSSPLEDLPSESIPQLQKRHHFFTGSQVWQTPKKVPKFYMGNKPDLVISKYPLTSIGKTLDFIASVTVAPQAGGYKRTKELKNYAHQVFASVGWGPGGTRKTGLTKPKPAP